MRKLFLIVCIGVAFAGAPWASAQVRVLPEHFGKWTGSPAVTQGQTQRLSPEVVREVRETEEAVDYTQGPMFVQVHLQTYSDPSSAYEGYTLQISPNMQPSLVGQNSAVDSEKLLMLLGHFVIEVWMPHEISTEDLQLLLATVKKNADQTPLPPIRMYLPKGFTDGTQKYARGPAGFQNALAALKREEFAGLANEAGFTSNAEAIVAEYRDGKDAAGLLLIEYPTPQLAEQHLRHLEQALSPAVKQAGTTIERSGSLLSVVLRPTSAAYAKTLRSAVNYETSVTWNEPRQTISDPPLLTTVAKIFIATFVFMVVAVVLGAAFGGVRVLAKTFFPGKFFDRPEQMDVLQLGLSGKRIDSRDFY
jgi:hypothetical protein